MNDFVYTIYNDDLDLDDEEAIVDDFCYANDVEEPDKGSDRWYDIINNYNNEIWDSEHLNLNKNVKGEIFAVANFGRWDGRYSGYKDLGHNLSDIFKTGDSPDYMWQGWGINTDGQLASYHIHHDSTDHMIYMMLPKSDLEYTDIMENIDEIPFDELKGHLISLAPEAAEVYGWALAENMTPTLQEFMEAYHSIHPDESATNISMLYDKYMTNGDNYDIVKVMAEAEREQALEEKAEEMNAGEQEIEDDSFTR